MNAVQPARESRFGTALEALRHEITDGRFRNHDMLPSERDLSDVFAVSRTTLRRVLSVLVQDGILTHRQGVGTFIQRAAPHARQTEAPTPTFQDLVATLAAEGRAPSVRMLTQEACRPDFQEAAILGVETALSIMRMSRLILVDAAPFALERITLPPQQRPDTYGAWPTFPMRSRMLQSLAAISLKGEEAVLLGASPGTAVLEERQIHYGSDNRALWLSRIVYAHATHQIVRHHQY